jgi:catechol 2,3-dioxygenase-like lactoylglutathione lyase family enzyme
MITGITTVAVYATDKEIAKRFYTDVLGFEVSADLGPTLCFLHSTNRHLYIYLKGGMQKAHLNAQSTRLSFFLETDMLASEAYRILTERGARPLQQAPEAVDEEKACFQVPDPDGNIIEIVVRK